MLFLSCYNVFSYFYITLRTIRQVRLDLKKRCQVLGVLLIYLTVVSAHIFYLPRITSTSALTYNTVLKRKIEHARSVNCLQRTDKAVFKENIKGPASAAMLTSIHFSSAGLKAVNLPVLLLSSKERSLHNRRYSYLSFCLLRIWSLSFRQLTFK